MFPFPFSFISTSDTGLAQVDNLYSYEFDGVGSYMDLGNVTDLNSLTAFSTSTWVNYSGTPTTSSHIFLSGGSGASNRFYIQLVGSTTIRYGSGSAPAYDLTVPIMSSGTWYHIATVHNGTSLDVYLNGIKQGATVTVVSPSTQIGDNFKIGEYFSPINFLWNGYLDEIGLFNVALTEQEVQSIYNATETGKTADLNDLSTPPIAWYRMGD